MLALPLRPEERAINMSAVATLLVSSASSPEPQIFPNICFDILAHCSHRRSPHHLRAPFRRDCASLIAISEHRFSRGCANLLSILEPSLRRLRLLQEPVTAARTNGDSAR
eukprot:4838568-Pleurochrysis_carterae.AAC.1